MEDCRYRIGYGLSGGQGMDWRDVDYEHLLKAMDIVDRIGVDAARARCNAAIPGVGYGFQPA